MSEFGADESIITQAKKDAILEKMSAYFSPDGQNNLFLNSNIEQLCVEYLECCGYIVSGCVREVLVHNVPYLTTVFYNSLLAKGRLPVKDSNRDILIASTFVDYIMEQQNCSKEASIKLCALIISTLIKYESYLQLRSPIQEFRLFAESNLPWLIKQAFIILENESEFIEDNSDTCEKEWESFVTEYVKNNGEESLGFDL